MKELNDYLAPLEIQGAFTGKFGESNVVPGNHAGVEKPDVPVLAFIAIEDRRTLHAASTENAAKLIKKQLYNLAHIDNFKLLDFGSLRQGKDFADTAAAVKDISNYFRKLNIPLLVVGNAPELIPAMFKGYAKKGKRYNITAIDSRLNIYHPDEISAYSYMSEIINAVPNNLFNYNSLGFQEYLAFANEQHLMDDLIFDLLSTGQLRQNPQLAEPVLRDTDLLVYSLNALKQQEAPGQNNPSPNGLMSDEACQLAKYAGLSDRIDMVFFTGYAPVFDSNQQSAALAAQILWYFCKGIARRRHEYPLKSIDKYSKFIVKLTKMPGDEDMVFYKSEHSLRWWLEVPYAKKLKKKPYIAACSKADYDQACNDEIPETYWKIFRKLN